MAEHERMHGQSRRQNLSTAINQSSRYRRRGKCFKSEAKHDKHTPRLEHGRQEGEQGRRRLTLDAESTFFPSAKLESVKVAG